MPEAGKFFISLGLNGAEKTLSGISQINDHFGGLKTLSTEAKLAILAALAGLEQMVSMGGKFGSQMTMLHEHLNVSIQDLQKYGNAAQIAGASTTSMFTAFGNIQHALEQIKLQGKGGPFMATLMTLMQQGGEKLSAEDILKMGNTPGGDVKFFNLMRRMINNTKVNPFDLYEMISENGILPTDIYDVVKQKGGKTFDKALSMAPSVSDSNVSKLNDLNMTWQQTLERFETALKNLSADPGIEHLVKGLDNFADSVNKLILWGQEKGKDKEWAEKLLGKDRVDKLMHLKFPKGGGFKNITQIFITATNADSKQIGQKAVDALNKGGFKAKTTSSTQMSSTVNN